MRNSTDALWAPTLLAACLLPCVCWAAPAGDNATPFQALGPPDPLPLSAQPAPASLGGVMLADRGGKHWSEMSPEEDMNATLAKHRAERAENEKGRPPRNYRFAKELYDQSTGPAKAVGQAYMHLHTFRYRQVHDTCRQGVRDAITAQMKAKGLPYTAEQLLQSFGAFCSQHAFETLDQAFEGFKAFSADTAKVDPEWIKTLGQAYHVEGLAYFIMGQFEQAAEAFTAAATAGYTFNMKPLGFWTPLVCTTPDIMAQRARGIVDILGSLHYAQIPEVTAEGETPLIELYFDYPCAQIEFMLNSEPQIMRDFEVDVKRFYEGFPEELLRGFKMVYINQGRTLEKLISLTGAMPLAGDHGIALNGSVFIEHHLETGTIIDYHHEVLGHGFQWRIGVPGQVMVASSWWMEGEARNLQVEVGPLKDLEMRVIMAALDIYGPTRWEVIVQGNWTEYYLTRRANVAGYESAAYFDRWLHRGPGGNRRRFEYYDLRCRVGSLDKAFPAVYGGMPEELWNECFFSD